jgi:hypothetical protein
LQWESKDPGEALDFSLFLHPTLSDPDDAIASVALSPSPGDLTAAAFSINGQVATAWLTGGTAGIAYTLAWTVTKSSGRVFIASGSLLCALAGSTAATSGNAISSITTATLTAALLALPTSPAGLVTGQAWLDGGTVKVVQ